MKRSDSELGLSCIGAIVLGLLAIVLGTIANGWALSTLWGWFVAPTFDVPSLTIANA